MNAYELCKPDGTPCGIYACGKCGVVYGGKYIPDPKVKADECCVCICKTCGGETRQPYTIKCDKCRNLDYDKMMEDKYNKAEKISSKDWDGPVFADGLGSNDGFFEDLDELEEYIEDNVCSFCSNFGNDCDCDHGEDGVITKPKYVWACNKDYMPKMDALSVCENHIEEYLPESMSWDDLEGWSELQKALDEFVAKNQDFYICDIDYSKAILMEKSKE